MGPAQWALQEGWGISCLLSPSAWTSASAHRYSLASKVLRDGRAVPTLSWNGGREAGMTSFSLNWIPLQFEDFRRKRSRKGDSSQRFPDRSLLDLGIWMSSALTQAALLHTEFIAAFSERLLPQKDEQEGSSAIVSDVIPLRSVYPSGLLPGVCTLLADSSASVKVTTLFMLSSPTKADTRGPPDLFAACPLISACLPRQCPALLRRAVSGSPAVSVIPLPPCCRVRAESPGACFHPASGFHKCHSLIYKCSLIFLPNGSTSIKTGFIPVSFHYALCSPLLTPAWLFGLCITYTNINSLSQAFVSIAAIICMPSRDHPRQWVTSLDQSTQAPWLIKIPKLPWLSTLIQTEWTLKHRSRAKHCWKTPGIRFISIYD